MGRPPTRPVTLRDGFYIEVRNKGASSGIKIRSEDHQGMLEAANNYRDSKEVVVLGEHKKGRWVNHEVESKVSKPKVVKTEDDWLLEIENDKANPKLAKLAEKDEEAPAKAKNEKPADAKSAKADKKEAAKPVAKPAKKEVAKPAAKAVAKPAAKAAAKPPAKPVAKKPVKPVAKKAAKPAPKKAVKAVAKKAKPVAKKPAKKK